jgi:hypothetical protein
MRLCQIDWNIIVQIITALFTLIVGFIAIWGDRIRSRYSPLRLKIEPQNLKGELTTWYNGPNSGKVYYYHLKVVNKSNWQLAKHCRVLLTGMYKKDSKGSSVYTGFNALHAFEWTPAEDGKEYVDITDSHVFDFGRIYENVNSFKVATRRYPNNFKGILMPNETIRYCLKIDAVGFRQKKDQIFEVTWNGQWSDDEEIMKNYITIKEVKY